MLGWKKLVQELKQELFDDFIKKSLDIIMVPLPVAGNEYRTTVSSFFHPNHAANFHLVVVASFFQLRVSRITGGACCGWYDLVFVVLRHVVGGKACDGFNRFECLRFEQEQWE